MKKLKKSLPILMAISSLFGSVANASESGGLKNKQDSLDKAVKILSYASSGVSLAKDIDMTGGLAMDKNFPARFPALSVIPLLNSGANLASDVVSGTKKGKNNKINKIVNYCCKSVSTAYSTAAGLYFLGESNKAKVGGGGYKLAVGENAATALLGLATLATKAVNDLKQKR